MNFIRAFTRETRYLRSSFQASRSAVSTAIASSFGTNTPRSRAMRGTEESPPPTLTAKPSTPSCTAPISAMQLISGALQRSAQAAHPRGRDAPARQLDPEHEGPDLRLVVVEAPPLQAHEVLLRHVLVPRGDQRRQLVEHPERTLLLLEPFHRVALQNELPGRLG